MHPAAEVELRRTLWKRIGAAAFIGVGEVLPRLSELNASDASAGASVCATG